MFENPSPMENKDLAKTDLSEDELGFEPFVKKVATGIKGYRQKECFVISVEGQWGIGKTTFMNLVKNEIHDDVEVLHFNPWLMTDIESLVVTFFSELMKVINRMSFDAKLKEEILKDMKKFLVGLSYLLPESVSFGFSGNKAKYNIRGTIDKVTAEKKLSLDEQKDKINEYLSKIYAESGKRIVIVVDDIDRLMDKETELIFRLIKGIADFNNIIYILLFDRKIVTASLKHFKSEDGDKYLDKVIQYPLVVPKPYEDKVREMLRLRLDGYLTSLAEHYEYPFDQEKWNELFPLLPKYVKTVRDVNKIFATVSFEYESICEDANFVDFLIITIIRLQAHELYQFIKDQPEHFSRAGSFGILTSEQRETSNIAEELSELIRGKVESFDAYFPLIQILFPIFDAYNPRDINDDHKNKPIADRHYFDHYFSMSVSASRLSHQQFSDLFFVLLKQSPNFPAEMDGLDDSRRVQFVQMLEQKEFKDNNDVLTISREVMRMLNQLDRRDFRNDNSFCDHGSYQAMWIDLISDLIVKHYVSGDFFTLFDDEHIEIQYRCHLLQFLKKRFNDNGDTSFDSLFGETLDEIIKTLRTMTLKDFLSHEYLDILSLCFYWNEVDADALKVEFDKELFSTKIAFFKIFEKYVYKQVSMPRRKFPYSINKSALGTMVDLQKVQEYIDHLEGFALSQDESLLLKYWENSNDY